MSFPLSRRRFIGLSALGALGASGYGVTRAVQKVRDSARQLSET
ncbi:MAG: twin-arginine translocation signal domain-containing protein [Planctomycetes bacterium]|nr:twin-arginine translocation signal domain-containing protein [Planctomycetota bacterium]